MKVRKLEQSGLLGHGRTDFGTTMTMMMLLKVFESSLDSLTVKVKMTMLCWFLFLFIYLFVEEKDMGARHFI